MTYIIFTIVNVVENNQNFKGSNLYYFIESRQQVHHDKTVNFETSSTLCKVVILGGWLRSSHPLKSRELLSPIAIPAFRWYQVTGEG